MQQNCSLGQSVLGKGHQAHLSQSRHAVQIAKGQPTDHVLCAAAQDAQRDDAVLALC